jgi:RNA polymerase sigma-70 factor (ECF subfamily)
MMESEETPLDFEALYTRYSGPIFQLAFRLLGDKDMAADAVQETFAKAFKARDSFRGESRPSTWLYRITYNLCMSALESRSRLRPLEGLEQADEPHTRPETALQSGETGKLVREALAQLDEEDRRLLCLQMDEELGYADLAAILGCSQEAVRQRVSRARHRLRDALSPFMEGKI